MAHVNEVTVQTTEGPQVVTKTSTHRDYVVATAVQRADGTQAVISWHMTRAAGEKYSRSNEAQRIARYGEAEGVEVVLLPVSTKLTGKDAKAQEAAPVEDAPAIVIVRDEAPKATTGTTGNTCRCGCGEAIGTKSQYRPGHDARHAGIVARDIAASAHEGHERTTADSDLGSEALVRKAHAMADRLTAKAAAKK